MIIASRGFCFVVKLHHIISFPSRDFMLQALEQLYQALQHLYQALQHLYQALQHKIHQGLKLFQSVDSLKYNWFNLQVRPA
jgi:phosphoglycerate-specific signal transduction histidine kinase